MPIPHKIKYEIDRELGSGAMGEVYYARDTRMLNRPVAIKILSERLLKTDIAHSGFGLEVEVAAKILEKMMEDFAAYVEDRELDNIPVVVRAKREKGRSQEYEEVDNFEWQARAEKLDDDDMVFTLPFPESPSSRAAK